MNKTETAQTLTDPWKQSSIDAASRSKLRIELFNAVRDDGDLNEVRQRYETEGKKLWHEPQVIFSKDMRIADHAKRGYKIVFGKDGIDSVAPVMSLDTLIAHEQPKPLLQGNPIRRVGR